MQKMWQALLPHPQETLRSLWLRRDYKAATLLMAKQEDQPDKNSLEPQFPYHDWFGPSLLQIEIDRSGCLWSKLDARVATVQCIGMAE